jgi:hypothetical protein
VLPRRQGREERITDSDSTLVHLDQCVDVTVSDGLGLRRLVPAAVVDELRLAPTQSLKRPSSLRPSSLTRAKLM